MLENHRRVRVLFITEFLPWPLNSGGRIRSYQILKQVSRRHEVTVVAASSPNTETYFREFVSHLFTVRLRPRSKMTKAYWALISLCSPQSFLLWYRHFRKEMAGLIKSLIAQNEFDLIHLDHLDAAIYMSCCQGIPTYLDEHNYETGMFRSVKENTRNVFLKWFLGWELRKLARVESEILNKAPAIGAVSEQDAILMANVTKGSRIQVIPNGVDLDYFTMDRKPLPFHIVSVGSLDWSPNVEGLMWFLEKVWPLISNTCQAATLQIVGRNPPRSLLKCTNDRISIAALVPDVRKYMKRAAAFIVPLFSGGGTRLKVLEAMAMKVPVIATSTGVDGIGCRDGEEVLIADHPGDFANNVMEVLKNDDLSARITSSARKLVEEKYDWNIIGDRLETVYQRLLGNKPH